MKIAKNEFEVDLQPSDRPVTYLNQVLHPFVPQIESRSISVFVAHKNDLSGLEIIADWDKYQLILFNMLQNAVKYNSFMGTVVFLLSCLPRLDGEGHILETEIIDSGIGISKER